MRQGKHVFETKSEVTSYKPGHASQRIFDMANLGQYSEDLLELVYSLVQVRLTE